MSDLNPGSESHPRYRREPVHPPPRPDAEPRIVSGWPEVDAGLFDDGRGAAPAFPLELLPLPWRGWVADTAVGAGAPVAYVRAGPAGGGGRPVRRRRRRPPRAGVDRAAGAVAGAGRPPVERQVAGAGAGARLARHARGGARRGRGRRQEAPLPPERRRRRNTRQRAGRCAAQRDPVARPAVRPPRLPGRRRPHGSVALAGGMDGGSGLPARRAPGRAARPMPDERADLDPPRPAGGGAGSGRRPRGPTALCLARPAGPPPARRAPPGARRRRRSTCCAASAASPARWPIPSCSPRMHQPPKRSTPSSPTCTASCRTPKAWRPTGWARAPAPWRGSPACWRCSPGPEAAWAGRPRRSAARRWRSRSACGRTICGRTARLVFDRGGPTDTDRQARRVVRWLKENRPTEVSREDVRRHALGRTLDAARTDGVLDRLCAVGALQAQDARLLRAGRPAGAPLGGQPGFAGRRRRRRRMSGGKGGKGGNLESSGNTGLSDDGAKRRKLAETGGNLVFRTASLRSLELSERDAARSAGSRDECARRPFPSTRAPSRAWPWSWP